MNEQDYWEECIALAADECDLKLTPEQLTCLAKSVKGGHEHYDMAFYQPPSSDRLNEIENEWKRKLKEKERELERYQRNAETAVKRALRLYPDSSVSIGAGGDVFSHGGRTTQIQ